MPDTTPEIPEQKKYDGFAIAALSFYLILFILNIGLSFICESKKMEIIVTIITFVCIVIWWLVPIAGIISIVRTNADKKLKGQSLAISSLIIWAAAMLMSVIFVPGFTRARESGQLTACESNLKNQGTALEMYAADNNGLFPSSFNTLSPEYLMQLPTCPSSEREYGYEVSIDHKEYTVFCSGKNAHKKKVHIKTGFPQYNSTRGLMVQ
ncbi:MAG: hypothetical protein M1269_05355 [Chloroflexi bacterium]|nr:hypothetical protein [Chloroflexota bacterium]